MYFRDKVKRTYFIVGIVLFILNMLIIPYFLSSNPMNVLVRECNTSVRNPSYHFWRLLGLLMAINVPLTIRRKESHFYKFTFYTVLKFIFYIYFIFSLINKTPLWKEWMESYYIRKYMKYVTSLDMTKEAAIKNISMLFNVFYFMFSVTIIYLLIAHIIELILTLTQRE